MTETNMRLEDWFDDLSTRFVMNVPNEDLESAERICFQIEEAQWFYEDFIRPLDPTLPSMSLRNFCEKMFAHCPMLAVHQGDHMQAFEYFLEYKSRVPVRGAIMLNEAMDSVVLVKGWKKGANWSFPRGKINMAEDDLDCAVREVYEETGLDLQGAGLVPEDRQVKYIDVNMLQQAIRLYVFRDVPEDTYFEPRTRKEISKIEWWKLSDLPAFRKKGHGQQNTDRQPVASQANKFYMVAPFLVPLRKWVIEQQKKDARRVSSNHYQSAGLSHDDLLTEEDAGAESGTQLYYPGPSGGEQVPETRENATASLNRLLDIQQASQDSEVEDTIDYQSAQGNSGSALLALLQNKPQAGQQRTQNPLPHTPQEHTIEQAPMPTTPHHHAPRPPHFSSMPPPLTFPIQQHQPQHTFSYQQPRMISQYQQSNQQMYVPNQQHPTRPRENPHHYQSQHLIHPQPLPPTVQKALFTGGPVHSPVVPQLIQQQQAPQHPTNASMTNPNPQFPGLHAPIVPQVRKQSPPKLTKHSLALLDAFKRRDEDVVDANTTNDLPLRRYAQGQGQPPVPRHQPQELPADASQAAQVPSIPQYMAQNTASNRAPNPGMFTARQPISETQRSTLLDIFKSPTSTSASPAKPLSATALPPSATPSAVELSAVEPLSTNAATTSALLNDKRTPDPSARDAPIPELNPEANLPYRAMTILSRPPEMSEKEASGQNGSSHRMQHRTQSNGKKSSSRSRMQEPAKTSPEKPFQPQILKRPQPGQFSGQESLRHVQPPMPSMQAPPMPLMQQPVLDHRKQQPADHRQNLLSLFGKPSTSTQQPSYSPSNGISLPAADPNMAARSRVGSLASAEAGSRRPSQAPTSPENQGFLLDYLGTHFAKGH
ncbi:related to decapping enzyme [Phialocephala subalpina]|uniref:Related to decapping enzyme n=1 Tax=Phialocephala subalpina TaxID=576137 RepID=A0A1L7WX14_9HELO|nr:related to decapping enzyme [Phialocephala subalpina]